MKLLGRLLLLVAILGCSAGAVAEVLSLSHRTYRDWDIVLPDERFERVSGDFQFPGSSAVHFPARLEGNALWIDRNADGTMESKVEGEAGVVTLRGRTRSGEKFLYALRLRRTEAGWFYAASGAVLGLLDEQKIRVIDQNNNGRYDDYGADALVLGQDRHACFLSKVVNIRGNLHAIDISRDGRQMNHEPYEGPRGLLDLSSRFDTKGKRLSVIVRSKDGIYSFNLADRPLEVPAGEYLLYQGRVGLGENRVLFTRGDMKPIRVEPGQRRVIALGEPIQIDFSYVARGGRAIMAPQLVRYLGRAGEEYETWNPFGGSPRFDVRDAATGTRISLAIFGGT